MKNFVKPLCCVFLFSIVGCGHVNVPFLGKLSDKPKESQKQPEATASTFIDKGSIINAQKLQQGRKIVIIPFTAGEGAESTDELDRVALMIIKGVSDAFNNDKTGKHTHFTILTAENSKEADLRIKGHITEMGKPSKLKRLVLLSGKRKLGIEGKITDIQTGETIVIFNDHAQSQTEDDDYKQLGYNIGKNIGQFILSGI